MKTLDAPLAWALSGSVLLIGYVAQVLFACWSPPVPASCPTGEPALVDVPLPERAEGKRSELKCKDIGLAPLAGDTGCASFADVCCEGETFEAAFPPIENRCIGKLNLDSATVKGDLHLIHSYVYELSSRGATINALTVESSAVGKVDLDAAEVKGTVSIESSSIGTFEGLHSKMQALEVRKKSGHPGGSRVESLILTSVDVAWIVIRESKVDKIDFTRVRATELNLERMSLGEGTLTDSFTQRLSIEGSKGKSLNLGSSTITRFDLQDRGAADVPWEGGQFGSLRHDGGIDGVLAHLRRQPQHNSSAFAALEKSLRDQGQPYAANRARVQALANAGSFRVAYLDAHGNPLAYVVLLGALIAFGACFFTAAGGARPLHVRPIDQPEATWKVAADSKGGYHVRRDPHDTTPERVEQAAIYSPVIMSLATLLPGDALHYLRNFKFVPQHRRQALGFTGLQLMALAVQGFIVASILSLLGN